MFQSLLVITIILNVFCITHSQVYNGTFVTIAGIGVNGYSGDGGSAMNAMLNYPTSVAVDLNGNIYVCDYGNNRIRKIAKGSGIITSIAGTGIAGNTGDGGQAVNAQMISSIVFVDKVGNIYIIGVYGSDCPTIRKITSDGIISTIFTSNYYDVSFSGVSKSYNGTVYEDSNGYIYLTRGKDRFWLFISWYQ